MEVEEIRLRRADKLPASVQKDLNIYDGLVSIEVVRRSPKAVQAVKPASALFSKLFIDARTVSGQ